MSSGRTRLLTVSALLALSPSLAAQQALKVPAPLPRVDLDDKAWGPTPPAAATARKTDLPPAVRPAPRVEPVKVQESSPLPGGRGFSLGQVRELLFDTTNGSAIWADAGIYKASFAADGFTFVPYFGSSAPQNYPVKLSLESAHLGTAVTPLSFATPQRRGDSVVLERGALEERYDLTLECVEQKFVVPKRFTGDLVLTLRVDTELQAMRDDAGLRFGNELGHVGYTNAVLVDASGRRWPMQTEHAQGVITLRADAATLATAAFPVTVDPIVTSFVAGTDTTYVRTNADIAFRFEAFVAPESYLVVWTRIFSASDTDIHAVSVDMTGAAVAGSSSLIDNSLDRWDDGRVASSEDNFLVVASRLPAGGGTRAIWGRIRNASAPYTMGAQFEISGAESGDKVSPDVGGEFALEQNFCVVWQRNYSATDHDIHYRILLYSGALGALGSLDNSGANDDYRPRIAKSNGHSPEYLQFWNVVWQRLVGGVQHDIIGRRVKWDGSAPDSSYVIDNAQSDDDTQPSVTSLGDHFVPTCFLVLYTTNNGGNLDIFMRVFQEGAVPVEVASGFLGTLESLPATERARDQFQSQTDSDGCRFVVSYLERFSASDRDAYISTLDLAPQLRAIDPRVTLTFSSLDTHSASITANRSGNGDPLLYGAVWDHNSAGGAVSSSIAGGIYRGTRQGPGFVARATGCGGLTISTARGFPYPGPSVTVRYDVAGATGPTFFMIGLPTPSVPMCPPASCALGTSMIIVEPGSMFVAPIPCAWYLVDGVVSVQGAAIGTPGGCASIGQLVLSDTIDTTIQ